MLDDLYQDQLVLNPLDPLDEVLLGDGGQLLAGCQLPALGLHRLYLVLGVAEELFDGDFFEEGRLVLDREVNYCDDVELIEILNQKELANVL